MKWTCIGIGIALIVSITVISCFMIYAGQYECENIVWWLYGLLVWNVLVGEYLMVMRLRRKERKEQVEQQNDKSLLNSFMSETMTNWYELKQELSKQKNEITNIKKSIF